LSSSPISGSFYFAGKPVAATQANLPAPAAAIGQTPLAPRDDAGLRRDLITDCDGLRRCPTIPVMRRRFRASISTRSTSRRPGLPATTP
jgi:hypothetical protein